MTGKSAGRTVKLDPRFDQKDLLLEAASRASRYLAELPERAVCANRDAVSDLEKGAATPFPDRGVAAHQVLAELDDRVSAATVANAGPRFFGFVQGGALPASLAAHVLATAWDQNAFAFASSPGGVLLERIAERWILESLYLPDTCVVSMTTGASLANLTALAAARHRVLAQVGYEVESDGLFGAPPVTVAISAEQHPTVRKALGLLGFGRERVVELAVDAQGRIDASRLPNLDGPLIVCAQAGNVNSGASDPFQALRRLADDAGGWLHVDGAFGLWAQATPLYRDQTRGVELADSWATDAHKWLNVPYDSGLAIVRDRRALAAAMSFEAAYLPVEGVTGEPFHHSAEASRRARGVDVWAALRSLGRSGLADLIEGCCAHARRFEEGLRGAGHEILNDVVLNQVVTSFGTSEQNAEIIDLIRDRGECWCGPTHWRGRDAMRISVSNWATREVDVERSLESILTCAAEVLATST